MEIYIIMIGEIPFSFIRMALQLLEKYQWKYGVFYILQVYS